MGDGGTLVLDSNLPALHLKFENPSFHRGRRRRLEEGWIEKGRGRKEGRKEGRKAGDAPTASDNKSLPYAKEKECVSRPRPKCLKGSKLQLSLVDLA